MKKPVKLNSQIVSLLEARLRDEFTAFYFYRDASNYCKNVGYVLASKFFSDESNSELEHAKGIENFLLDWNVQPSLSKIDYSGVKFKGLDDIIEKAYNIEYKLYEDYESISLEVLKLGDVCVFGFLEKYRMIQKDSVAEYSDMINLLEGCDIESKFEMLKLEEKLFGE